MEEIILNDACQVCQIINNMPLVQLSQCQDVINAYIEELKEQPNFLVEKVVAILKENRKYEKVEAFIKREEPLEIAHESIAKAAKLLIQNDTPLSKHQAYRNMKEISSEYDYILKCSSNSEIPKPHGIKLQDNVDAYFYAML